MSKQYDIHDRENNDESEKHLNGNRKKFSAQCARVLQLFEGGIRLTSKSAMVDHGVGHLARRVKDLKDYHGINIKDEWEPDKEGGTRNKVWFIDPKTEKTKEEVVSWWKNYLRLNPGTKLIQSELFK